jgi:AcrR family transcriptional regulator
MRRKEINPNDIIEATIHLVAKNGLENLSTRKITSECNISEGSLFYHFNGKTDLLVQCLYHIDEEIDHALQQVHVNLLSLKKSVRLLWFTYFDFLIHHRDYTQFYMQFRHSSYYTDDVIHGQDKSYSFFTELLKKVLPALNINTDIFWVYVIETTLNFAIRVSDGQLPCTDQDKDKYFSLIANGIGGVFKSTKNW